MSVAELIFRPQVGPQEMFMASDADIRIIGGAAGGGKTFATLLELLRYITNSQYRATVFRRESTQLTKPGGIWDESQNIYRAAGGVPRQSPALEWVFPSGARIQFSHLNQESDIYAWQGSQQAIIGFEELTHFTRKQFFYMLSRIRSMSGIAGGIVATCNPDPDSWVKQFILWWLDDEGRYADPAKAGKKRWFIVVNDELVWADTKEELIEQYPKDGRFAKSVAFFPALLTDNKVLMEKDPQYEANLNALCLVDRERLKGGDWLIREAAGTMFKRHWFPIVDAIPGGEGNVMWMRYWDRAAIPDPDKQQRDEADKNKNPDYTSGTRIGRLADGRFIISAIHRFRGTPLEVKEAIKNTASQDGRGVIVGIEQDPGQAGVSEAEDIVRSLAGYEAYAYPVQKNKIVRAKPLSAAAEAGNILLLRGEWNEPFLKEAESFPEKKKKKDQVDSTSGGFNELCKLHDNQFWVG